MGPKTDAEGMSGSIINDHPQAESALIGQMGLVIFQNYPENKVCIISIFIKLMVFSHEGGSINETFRC